MKRIVPATSSFRVSPRVKVHAHGLAMTPEDLPLNPDTPLSEASERAERAKMGLKIAAALLGAAAMLAIAHVMVDGLVIRGTQFQLARVQFLTTGNLNEDYLLRQSGLQVGKSMAALDLKKVRENLLEIPAVADLSIERTKPGHLMVHIKERIPVAWLQCPAKGLKAYSSESGYLIDAEGYPLKCRNVLRADWRLPVIEVPDIRGFAERVPVDSAGLRAALEYLRENNEVFFEEQYEVKSIQVLSTWLMAVTYRNDSRVLAGTRDIRRQLNDLKRVMVGALRNSWVIEEINLIPRDNIPVRFAHAPSLASARIDKPLSGATGISGRSDTSANSAPPVAAMDVPEASSSSAASPELPVVESQSLLPPEVPSAPAASNSPPAAAGTTDQEQADVRAILGGLYESP